MEPERQSRLIVGTIAAVVVLAVAVVVAYQVQRAGSVPETMRFELHDEMLESVNATVLDFEEVHRALFLEDHLDTAIDAGVSVETVQLRIDQLRATLHDLTRAEGPVWNVKWNGHLVVVTHSVG